MLPVYLSRYASPPYPPSNYTPLPTHLIINKSHNPHSFLLSLPSIPILQHTPTPTPTFPPPIHSHFTFLLNYHHPHIPPLNHLTPPSFSPLFPLKPSPLPFSSYPFPIFLSLPPPPSFSLIILFNHHYFTQYPPPNILHTPLNQTTHPPILILNPHTTFPNPSPP